MQQCLSWYVSCAIGVKKAAQTTKIWYKGQPDIRDTFKSSIASLISGFSLLYLQTNIKNVIYLDIDAI